MNDSIKKELDREALYAIARERGDAHARLMFPQGARQDAERDRYTQIEYRKLTRP